MGSCQIINLKTVCLGNWKRCKRKYQSQFEKPEKEVNNLYPTEDGKAGEEAHGAAYHRQLVHQLSPPVLRDLVVGRGGKIDPDKVEFVGELVA